jgi:RNA polymerase sigma factor (sigma-70 family)
MSADQQSGRIAQFFRNEAKRLLGYVRRRVENMAQEDAEDIVQDVMLGIFDRADITAPIENLSAYVYRALYNRVVDGYRKRKENRTVSLDAYTDHEGEHTLQEVLGDMRFDVHDEYERKMIWNCLFDAIEDLKPSYRDVFIATEFEGFTFRELSELRGVPVGTLLSRKHRAVKQVRAALAYIYDTKGAIQ